MPIRPPWFEPQMLVGTTLQGYHLSSLVGAGGFGAVYRTEDAHGESRAAKVLYPPHSLGNEDMHVWTVRSTHFLGEATTAASFHHPNIIRVYTTRQAYWSYQDPHKTRQGHFDVSGAYPLQLYLAEYIPDGVDRHLDQGQLFSPDETTSIAVQICDALSELHSANPQVVHRDLNPGNILLANGDRAVVTDFGLARMEGLPSAYIEEGPIFHKGVGAPEQFAGENGDRLTDIYQLGALLVVMLTGRYHNQGGRDLLADRLDIPTNLSETILRCMQQNKAQRFQSVADLRNSLLGRVASAVLKAGPPPHSLSTMWSFPLTSPNWRTWDTPVLESPDGCFIWDRQELHRVDPTNGKSVWSWAPPPRNPQSGIRDGPHSPAVQASGELLYVRHGGFISCLRTQDRAKIWEYQHWSDATGDFLLSEDLLFLDSHRAPSGRLGPAALDVQTGELVWHLEEPYYHVTGMVATATTLALVENRGLGGLGGSRVRLLERSSGKALAIYDLSCPNESYVGGTGGRAAEPGPNHPEAGVSGGYRPLGLPDGSLVVWSAAGNGFSGLEAQCFDSELGLRWTRRFDFNAVPTKGEPTWNPFLLASANRLLYFRGRYPDDQEEVEGWIVKIDWESGEPGQWMGLPEYSVPLSGVAMSDGSILLLTYGGLEWEWETEVSWQLMSLNPDNLEVNPLDTEGSSYRQMMPLAPIASESVVYLQIPSGPAKPKGQPMAGPPVAASIAAFRWQ